MNLHSISRLLLSALALSLPLTAAGCGQTACFIWNVDEGACPAQDKAMQFFSDPDCPSAILSVDSEGNFGNDLCCYAVTKDDANGFSEVAPCSRPGGTGGAGGSFSTGGTAATVGTTGSGGGGPTGCVHCEDALSHDGRFASGLCTSSQLLLDDLSSCLCSPSGPCMAACMDNFCLGGPLASQACIACLTDDSMGCSNQFLACAKDL